DERSEQVSGEEIGRELDAPEARVDRRRERAHGQGLGEARDALDQDVPPGEDSDQQPVEEVALADDRLAHLREERLDEGRPHLNHVMNGLNLFFHLSKSHPLPREGSGAGSFGRARGSSCFLPTPYSNTVPDRSRTAVLRQHWFSRPSNSRNPSSPCQ